MSCEQIYKCRLHRVTWLGWVSVSPVDSSKKFHWLPLYILLFDRVYSATNAKEFRISYSVVKFRPSIPHVSIRLFRQGCHGHTSILTDNYGTMHINYILIDSTPKHTQKGALEAFICPKSTRKIDFFKSQPMWGDTWISDCIWNWKGKRWKWWRAFKEIFGEKSSAIATFNYRKNRDCGKLCGCIFLWLVDT